MYCTVLALHRPHYHYFTAARNVIWIVVRTPRLLRAPSILCVVAGVYQVVGHNAIQQYYVVKQFLNDCSIVELYSII